MASVFNYGSPTAGVGAAGIDAYLAARRLAAIERDTALRAALDQETLTEARRQRATRDARPGDIAALLALPPMRRLPGADPTTIVPQPSALPPGQISGLTEAPGDPNQRVGPMPGPQALGMPSIAPVEAMTDTPAGRTLAEVTRALGADRVARLQGDPQGRAILKDDAGLVSEEESARRANRAASRRAAAKKFSEAHAAYLSENPDEAARGLLLESAALRELALVVDRPEPLIQRADERTRLYLEALKEPRERKRAGQEFREILSAWEAYTPGDIESRERLFTALTDARTRAGQRRADELLGQLTRDVGDTLKFGPDAQWDKAVAQAIQARRQRGAPLSAPEGGYTDEKAAPPARGRSTPLDMAAIYKEAAEINPAAFARYVDRVFKSGKKLPAALERLLGIHEVPENIQEEAHSLAAYVDRQPIGSAGYYTALSKHVTELTKQRHRDPVPRPDKDHDRSDLLRYRDQVVRELEKLEREIGRAKDNPLADVTAQERRSAALQDSLRAVDDQLADKGYIPQGAATARRERVPEATAPPAQQTKQAVKAELKRLMSSPHSLGQRDAVEAMRKKGWNITN